VTLAPASKAAPETVPIMPFLPPPYTNPILDVAIASPSAVGGQFSREYHNVQQTLHEHLAACVKAGSFPGCEPQKTATALGLDILNKEPVATCNVT
jgi:hypothetical protein